ncbi:isoprenoid biosynthesis protein ElbB [Hahella sp. KA22]|uniref:isoprenoid biosynthesis glyoxalase ElbB n=1 Tax=Hahella sp. KA22 TaxID=1628392 RepID=UPI000FDF2BF8|nr:isoprenoid biosynthesis glyoxalase ElbB [Hahella sp. KA22]AZZ91511.1 isoprenoid biosynthesis protein ElbB [Hahella sp. KA22]QAY54880.1 isoprenoid biosynthesis protein ElbB [Hahella sp. KA22]
MANIAVVLSGCGYLDGAEIYESVITLLALDSNDAKYQCFAPDINLVQVVNHISGEPVPEASRNVLLESARLARGDIKELSELDPDEFDALIFPGGFGAAKNLSTFAVDGVDMKILPQVERVAKAFAESGKPAGYICIAPTMIPHIYGDGVKCTIGDNRDVAGAIESMGGQHVNCAVDDIVVDEGRKVASTPAYMLAGRISEAATGIEKLVRQILTWID